MLVLDRYLTAKYDYHQLNNMDYHFDSDHNQNEYQIDNQNQNEYHFDNENQNQNHNQNQIDNENHNENHNNIYNQKGGGSWSVGSDGNDSTHDMLSEYKITEYDFKTEIITYKNSIKDSNKSLDMMFKDYEKYMNEKIKKMKISKQYIIINDSPDFYDLPHNYAYLGVVMWMLYNNYPIHTKYLYRILAHAYFDYFLTINIKEASGWFTWNDRRLAIINEIRTINYAINTAKNNIAQLTIMTKKGKCSGEQISTFICDIFKKNPEKIMDKYYIKYKKRKPEYSFLKYSVEPGIDAKLLHVGTIMMGHNGKKDYEAYIVTLNNHKKIWSLYDSSEYIYSNYIEDKYITDIYGQQFYKVTKRKKI